MNRYESTVVTTALGRPLCTAALVLLMVGLPVRGDATVWTNGAGQGGATVRIPDRGGQARTSTFVGTGAGELQWVSGNDAAVQVA